MMAVNLQEIIDCAMKANLYVAHNARVEQQVNVFKSVNNSCIGAVSYLDNVKILTSNPSFLKGVLLVDVQVAQPEFLALLTCSYVVSLHAKYLYALIYKNMREQELVDSQQQLLGTSNPKSVAASAQIDRWVVLGEDVEIGHGVVITGTCIIGNGTRIKANTVIGARGFGYAVRRGFPPLEMPHFGGVQIGEFVDVGANCSIDQGSFSSTQIQDHVKIDNGVHIAHNVRIGVRTLIAAHAEISGSVQIGDDVWIGPNASIRDGIKIGDGALVGIGSVVTKDVEENTVVYGSPARAH